MSEKRWYEKQLRIMQTVLREPDIAGYNADEVVRYLEEIEANCFVINGGGIVDFFRHELPTANPNPFMTNEDILKDLTEKCHEKEIKVIVRVDFRGVDKRVYELHPDWFAVDEHGKPVFWNNTQTIPNPLYAPCYLSFYRNEHAYRFADVLFEKYDIDGIWENSPFQYGVCYCKRCSVRYKRDTGKELPRGGDFYSEQYDEYRAWKGEMLLEHLRNYQKAIKKHGEDKIYCGEIFGLFYEKYKSSSSDLYNVKDSMDFMITPLFTAPHEPLHAPSTLIKFLRNLDADKTPIMLFGHLGTNNELRYVSSSPEETKIWMWQAVSAGGSLWNCVFNGQHPAKTHDRRNAYLVKEVYSYMKKYEDLLHGQRPVAATAIYYSRNSNMKFNQSEFIASDRPQDPHANRARDHYVTNLIGVEQVLLDRHIQYDIFLDIDFSLEKLKNTKLLIVPNGGAMSDREAEVIRQFVYHGGHLLATYQTSLYDENGKEREDFALRDVFGCSYTGIKKDGSHYGYQLIKGNHPLTKGFEETELIANWGENLLVLPDEQAQTEIPITYVPQIYPQSPERSWLRSLETKYPTAVVNRFGKGKVVYFPYEVDRNVWMHGHKDFSTVLGNAVEFLLEDHRALKTDAPASVQLALTHVHRRPGCYLLHAINLTSFPRRPVETIFPVRDVTVELSLPAGKLKTMEVLKGHAGTEIRRSETDNGKLVVEILIPEITEYAGLLIETE